MIRSSPNSVARRWRRKAWLIRRDKWRLALTGVAAGIGCALLAGCMSPNGADQDIVFPRERWQVAEPATQGIDPEALRRAIGELDEICGDLGSRRAVVIHNGYLIWAGQAADEPTAVWSCTKSFLSTCFGLLWDDGLCSPDTKLAAVCPEYAKQYPDVTLGQLATFTSGYAHEAGNVFAPAEPMFPPGEAFHYSRQSDVLALALTRLAGKPLRQLFTERIGSPIGITDDRMSWRDHGVIGTLVVNGGSGLPETGIHVDALTMARFGWLYANRGVWRGRRLVSEKYLDAATRTRVTSQTPPFDPDGWYHVLPGRYGLNWWVNGTGPDGRKLWPSAPDDAFAAQGNRNNICIVIPSWRLVLVRLGGDQIIDVARYDKVLAGLREAMGEPPPTATVPSGQTEMATLDPRIETMASDQ